MGGNIKKGIDTRYRKQGTQQRHSKINPRIPTVKQTKEQHPDGSRKLKVSNRDIFKGKQESG